MNNAAATGVFSRIPFTPMQTSLPRFLLGLFTAVLLSQCVSTPQTRIERNPQLFSQLSPRERQLVSDGIIREGLTRDAVFLAWGRPDRVSAGANRGKELETWIYLSERPVRTMNMSLGYGHRGWGGYDYGGWGGYPSPYGTMGPSVLYMPYTAGLVEFTNDRVTRWMANPR